MKEWGTYIVIGLMLIYLYQIGSAPDQPNIPIVQTEQSENLRQQIVQTALSQLGKPYNLGSEGPDQFDCSGFIQWTYAQYGIETTRTTFTQLDALRKIEPNELQPGDLIYQQFPSDQHVVMWAGDLDGNGTGDAVNAGGYFGQMNVNVIYDFFENNPVFTEAIIGYRSVL